MAYKLFIRLKKLILKDSLECCGIRGDCKVRMILWSVLYHYCGSGFIWTAI